MNNHFLTQLISPVTARVGSGTQYGDVAAAAATAAAAGEPLYITIDTSTAAQICPPDSIPWTLQPVSPPAAATAGSLFCGDCSVGLESSSAFFNHWLAHHCQPHSPSNNVSERGPDQLVMQRCPTCNHIFVEGTERCAQHAANGCVRAATPASSDVSSQDHKARKRKGSGAPGQGQLKKVKDAFGTISGSKHCVCGACHTAVKSITSYFLHWLEHHQKREGEISDSDVLQEVWQCKACPSNITRLFPDCQMLTCHMLQDHPREQESVQFSLNECDNLFPDEDACNQHYSHYHLNSICMLCGVVPANLCHHFTDVHAAKCRVCGVLTEKSDMKSHYLSRHKCELVWNRQKKLEILTSDKILSQGNGKKPTRLANGAIAKSELMSPVAVVLDNNSSVSLGATGGGNQELDLQHPKQASPAAVAKELQNEALKEKFLPVGDGSGFKCTKCNNVFVNEKLMEKHYFANHEFRCKFCEQIMDKDFYGVHLRQHLASERRKTNYTSAPSGS